MKKYKKTDHYNKYLSKRVKFFKKLNKKEKENLWDLLSDYEKYKIFLKVQKKVGYGRYKFSLNEYAINLVDLSKYKNLKEWDKEQYIYQKKHGQTHLDKKYKIYMFGDWCRLIENKKLIYGELFSLSSYIFDNVCEELNRFEDGLYPHKTKFSFIKNKDNKYSTMKIKTNAYGKEDELKEFSSFKMKFEYEILAPKIKKYILKNIKNTTYRIVDKKDTFDNFHLFLFSDKSALKNCRFEDFLSDFNKLKRDDRELKVIERKFVKYSKKYLMNNFKYDKS